MDAVIAFVIAKYNYWIYIILMMIGLAGMIIKKNLIKKIIGMNIFQTAIILFYISTAAKKNASIPIIAHAPDGGHTTIDVAAIINPLPHVLMLTAIVVAVATLGLSLALVIKIYRQYQTLEEDEIIDQIREK
jgi:multicomponent Na+:H+ antiporter subunit C